MKETILWFQDSVKLRSPERKWGQIDVLTERLIKQIGRPRLNHLIIKPEDCMRRLRDNLAANGSGFSCAIDLGGFKHWTDNILTEPTPVVGKFHLSRVRNITSHRLDGSGFLSNLNPAEISQLASQIDLTNPLFIDDVGWSGRTALKAAEILGVESATFGFLATNVGNFGKEAPGGQELLERAGMRVVAGVNVETPKDDGFHLSDFFDHPSITQRGVFDVIIRIQELRETNIPTFPEPDTKREDEVKDEIRRLLLSNREVFFPNSKSSEEMKTLQAEGRFTTNGGIPRNSFFGTNPPNWLMPSFSARVSSRMMRENEPIILDTLLRLREILDIWRFL